MCGCSNPQDSTVVLDVGDVDVVKNGGLVLVDGQLFTGSLVQFYPSGDTSFIEQYKKGKLEGTTTRWFLNGQKKEKRLYLNNRKHGFHQGWYEDGKKAFEYHFLEGQYTDTIKEWYDNGQLYQLSVYKNGQQEGRQKAWKRDGELYLNYDVKNGRKYGNSGIKHCKSLWSDVVDSN